MSGLFEIELRDIPEGQIIPLTQRLLRDIIREGSKVRVQKNDRSFCHVEPEFLLEKFLAGKENTRLLIFQIDKGALALAKIDNIIISLHGYDEKTDIEIAADESSIPEKGGVKFWREIARYINKLAKEYSIEKWRAGLEPAGDARTCFISDEGPGPIFPSSK